MTSTGRLAYTIHPLPYCIRACPEGQDEQSRLEESPRYRCPSVLRVVPVPMPWLQTNRKSAASADATHSLARVFHPEHGNRAEEENRS